MTREDINNIIQTLCPNNDDFEKPIISPAYLKQELEAMALEQKPCSNAIDRAEAIKIASGYCHPANVAKELAKLPPVTPKSCEVEDAKQAYSKGFEDCRQAVLEQINCWIGSGEYRYTNATHYLMERVKHIPSVNPQEPKTGHWIEHNAKSYECSECHNTKSLYASYKTDYCHDCGVKMVELRESEDNENNNE